MALLGRWTINSAMLCSLGSFGCGHFLGKTHLHKYVSVGPERGWVSCPWMLEAVVVSSFLSQSRTQVQPLLRDQ